MVSTFLSYRLYTADLAKTVSRTLSNAQVAREADYYRENIGKVGTVDEFLDDRRLYTYAMKAFGLEDMTYAKAFMRKVLESDVADADSFVRKLVDQRYLTFARAFKFTTDGVVDPGFVMAQESADEAETIGLYSQNHAVKGAAAATEAEYYQSRLPTLSSVDDLLADDRLLSFALEAFEIDPDIASKPALRTMLVMDAADPENPANKYATLYTDARYQKFIAAFSFTSDGSVPTPGGAQSASQLADTIDLHYEASGGGASPAAAAYRSNLFTSLMGDITNVDDFVANAKLRDYALTAVGLDPILISNDTLRSILTSDLSDPESFANTATSDSYRTLSALFNFDTAGLVPDGAPAQTELQQTTLVDLYLVNYGNKAATADQTQTSYYKLAMSTVFTADDLVNDTRLFTYVLTAFGLDPADETKSKIKQVLQSDPADPTSFARRLRDDRYTALAAAFNFDANGDAQGSARAQLSSSKTTTVSLYTSRLGEFDIDKARGKTESDYYSAMIDNVESVDDLLKDRRLVTYVLTAYGFEDEGISDQTLRQVFTSDLFDLKSFVNKSENYRFRELAAAFSFDTNGSIKRVEVGKAQDADDLLRTQDAYIRQTIEEQAGDQNQGVRLALYFQRKASSITTAYSILADKALLEVVMTALALPEGVAAADIDVQAKMIEKRLDLADLKDPEKLEKFLARFTALYDLNNPQASTSSSIPSLLLGQTQGAVFGEDILTSIQTLKLSV